MEPRSVYEHGNGPECVRLLRVSRTWVVEFGGGRAGSWASPDAAAIAAAQHRTGLPAWDRGATDAPRDILDWRPIGRAI